MLLVQDYSSYNSAAILYFENAARLSWWFAVAGCCMRRLASLFEFGGLAEHEFTSGSFEKLCGFPARCLLYLDGHDFCSFLARAGRGI